VLERFDDMAISGNRHPFRFDYRLAVEPASKRLVHFDVRAWSNCGGAFFEIFLRFLILRGFLEFYTIYSIL
jgi:hypothetical protein